MDVTLRFIEPGEIDDTVEFFRRYWGEGHILARDRRFLEWQLSPRRSPVFEDAGLAALGCFHEGRMVGMVGLQATDFNCDGDVAPGVWLTNLMSAPDFVEHGIGTKLMTGAHRLPFNCYGLIGINLSVIPMYRAMRYHCADATPRFFRVIDREAASRLFSGDGVQAFLSEVREPRIGPANGIAVSETSPPEDWDAFWTRYTQRGHFGIHRDAAFLRWRYIEHPRFDYRLLFARDQAGRMVGGAVWRMERIRDRDEQVMRLIEITAVEDDAYEALLSAVEGIGQAARVAFVDHYSMRPNEDVFRAQGWINEFERPDVIVPSLFQPLVPQSRKMNWATRIIGLDDWKSRDWSANIHIAKSDGDQDRPN